MDKSRLKLLPSSFIKQVLVKSEVRLTDRPPDKSAYWKINFLISQPKHMFKLMG